MQPVLVPTITSAGDDEARAEPVILLAFIEHDLQGPDSQGQQSQANPVNAADAFRGLFSNRVGLRRSVGQQQRQMPTGMFRKKIQRHV